MPRPLAFLCALALLSGCGSGDGDDGGAAPESLVPGDRQMTVLDMAAAREALDLPEDADPLDLVKQENRGDRALQRLFGATAAVLPTLNSLRVGQVVEALDLAQVDAIAFGGLGGPDAVTAVRSRKAPDDVLEELQRGGWKRHGSFLESDRPRPGPGEARWATRAEGGLLVLAGSRRALTNALEGGARGGPARMALDSVEGPLRLAVAPPAKGCIRTIAAGDRLDPAEGELAIRTSPPPDAERVAIAGEEQRGVRYGRARVDGDTAVVPVGYADAAGIGAVLQQFIAQLRLERLYRC